MGAPKTARTRKGKKAWRKNIDDAEVVAAVQQETHQERRGPAVETLHDDQLFFEDKGSGDAAAVAAAVGGPRRAKAKREKRPTRAQLILQAPQALKPVVAHKSPKRKVQPLPPPRQQQQAKQQEEEQQQGAHDGALVVAQAQRPQQAQQRQAVNGLDLWDGEAEPQLPAAPAAAATKLLKPVGPTSRAGVPGRRALPAPRIKAVEVDAPGCSYNPEPEAHQDALAALVASEHKKLLKQELARPGLPLMTIDMAAACRQQDELAMLQTDADMDEDENEIPLQGEGGGGGGEEAPPTTGAAAARRELRKKTKKDRNREARVAAEAKAAEAKRALKRQRAALQALPHLVEEVEDEETARAARRARRQVVQEEKAAAQPPKLSKHKFEDLHVQVLTSDEVGQGLRRLKPFPMLAVERFKSLQKRGLLEVRRPVGARATKRRVVYEKGARTEKATGGQEELEKLKAANRKAARQSKA